MGASNWWLADHIGDKNGWDNVQKLSYYTALEEQDNDEAFKPKEELYKGEHRDNFLISIGVIAAVIAASAVLFGVCLIIIRINSGI